MTVLLVILTFAAFILVDSLLARPDAARHPRIGTAPVVAPEPVWVAGCQLPEGFHYHPGHTWASVLDGETVAVGLDDFARRLLGPARAVAVPEVGTWIEEGEPLFSVGVNGRTARLVAPVTGEIVETNDDLADRPGLVSDDPYGRGWVVKVRPSHLSAGLRNLLSGSLARRFMEDARAGIDLRLMALSGSVLQDGGEPVADFARHLSNEEWKRLVGEFLLT
jgi:glycine cleavage system H lipoate-binding protein